MRAIEGLKKKLNKVFHLKNLSIYYIILLGLSLLPLLIISFYNHPTGDDIFYGLEAHMAFKQSNSIFSVLKEAWEYTLFDYNRWQGTFIAIFLMRIQPSIFSDKAYFITTFITLGGLMFGTTYLCKQIFTKIFQAKNYIWIGISALILLIQIQYVPEANESFYWYNGSIYYTGFFGLMLILAGIIVKHAFEPRKWHYVPGIFLAFSIGGSNYITALLSSILLFLYIAACAIKKTKKIILPLLCFLFMEVSFIISIIAPGNAKRQATSMSLSPIKTVAKSLQQGFVYCYEWADKEWLLVVLLLIPFFLVVIKKSSFSFSYPIIFIGLVYGLFCSMSCPTFYSMNNTGPIRVVNIIYFGFILFSFICVFYLLGWFYRKYGDILDLIKKPYFFMVGILLGIVIFSGSIFRITTSEAMISLVKGTAKAYHHEYLERLAILGDDSIQDVVFEPYQNQPKTIYVGDYGSDPEQGSNQKLAVWYNKKSVIVNYP